MKLIRNKLTGHPEGYGFVEFTSHAVAEKILQTYNGTQMPQTEQPFRLNWASFGIGERRPEAGPEHSIFVGDLAPDVTDYILQETFRLRYPSVKGAKVVIDVNTGRSKGYGFVRFGEESERSRAMTEMNGVYCSSRPMRISAATPRKAMAVAQPVNSKASYQSPGYSTPPSASQTFVNDNDPNNTTTSTGWGQAQPDPNQWNASYYGYGQGYDNYGYAANPQDTGSYGYVAYGGYGNEPQQMEAQAVVGTASNPPSIAQASDHEEIFDPLAPPDIDKLNASYIAIHEASALGRHLWLKTSEPVQAA